MYLDSAIIVKLIVDEPDSDFFKNALTGVSLSTCELAMTEVFAALLSKERAQLLSEAERQIAWDEFNTLIDHRFLKIWPFDSDLLRRARHTLTRCHPQVLLRTLDSIHVAACDLSHDFPICATDSRMRDAATLLGIPVFPEKI